jgi:hypothetical protein
MQTKLLNSTRGNIKMTEGKQKVILTKHLHDQLKAHELCGYSNCFRPYFKHRGFMPCCKFHYEHPQKWGKDGQTYTGSFWKKKPECVICQKITTTDFDGYCQSCHDEIAARNIREGTVN